MKTSTVFKNRWWAVLWGLGILWFAYDVAASAPGANDGNNSAASDASGAPATSDDQQHLAQAINSI